MCLIMLTSYPSGMEVGDLSTGCVTKYIQLCCQYEPDLVLFLVRRRNDFKISFVLESVRQFQLEESEAVLLEKSGDFQVTKSNYQEHWPIIFFQF